MRTRLDLLKPNIECNLAGNKQKSDHDGSKHERKLHIGQKVMLQNYRDSKNWMAGVISQSPLS